MDEVTYNKMIEGMCLTHRHDFGLLSPEQQRNIRIHMKQLYEHNIKPIIDSMDVETPNDEQVTETPFSVKEYIVLVEDLATKDAIIVNMAFGVSEALGIVALRGSMDSFEAYLRSNDAIFIRGMSIEWRTYLIKLLMCIDDQYKDVATSRILLG